MIQYHFELTGPHAGKTINLGGYQFVSGIYTHETNKTDELDGIAIYLDRAYQAYRVGSAELEKAKAAYEGLLKGTPVVAKAKEADPLA